MCHKNNRFFQILFSCLLILYSRENFAITYTVTNTNDSGTGSFRQAIIDANSTPVHDNIVFNVGVGAQTITLLSALTLTTPAFIDGSSQPGFSGVQLIKIAGLSMFKINGTGSVTVQWLDFSGVPGSSCIVLNSVNNCTITNNNFSNAAIGLHFATGSTSNVITNNIINSTTNNGILMNTGTHYGSVINDNSIMNGSGVAINVMGTPASITGNTLIGTTNAIGLHSTNGFTLAGIIGSGPNVNFYGNHSGKILMLNQCSSVLVHNWDFVPIVSPPLNTRSPLWVSGCTDCLFHSINSSGMFKGIDILGFNTTNTITSCNFSNSSYHGISMDWGSNSAWVINNNNLSNCGTSLYYQDGTPSSISGNTLTGSSNAFVFRTVNNFTLSPPGGSGPNSNVMGGHTNSVLNIQQSNNINISNWNISSITAPPLNIRTPIVVYLSQNCLFTNNTVTGMYTAMQFTQSNMSHTITNNDVSGATFVGIQITGGSSQGVIVNNNNMSNCGFWLQFIGGIPVSINSNTFTGSARAIELGGINNFTLSPPGSGGPNTNVYGNHTQAIITLSSCNGINISNWDFIPITATPLNTRTPLAVYSSSGCVFNNNNLAGMKTGLLFSSVISSNNSHTITNSNMSGAAEYGIAIFASGNSGGYVITNNDLSNCGLWGLRAPGTHSNISGNNLTGSTNGIFLGSAANFTLGPNSFGNQTGTSIHLFFCNGVYVPNTITGGAGGTGILLEGSNNCVINNNMSCGRQYGIRVLALSSNNSILTSSIGSCITAGIQLELNSATTTINAVSFSNNNIDIVNSGTNTVISGTTTGNFAPLITANSGSICAGQSFTITPGGGISYTYFGGGPVVSPTVTSTYSVVGTSTSACVGTAISTVVVASPTISVNSGTVCSGNSFTIIPFGANTYTIEGGSTVVTPSVSTTYTVIGTGANGCTSPSYATSNILVNASPTITVNSGTICNGQTFTIMPGGASTYTFEGGSAIVNPTSTTSYTVSGTAVNGCPSQSFATSYVTYYNSPAPILTVNSGSICPGNSFSIQPSGADTYTVQGGSWLVSPTTSSTYIVAGTATTGCISSNSTTVTVVPYPIITVNSGSICSGESFTIVPSGANTYTYQGGSTVVNPIITTSYTVTGTNNAGCISQGFATSTVTVYTTPTISVNSGTICLGETFTIVPSGANSYSIQGGNSIVSPGTTSIYTVTGTSSNGCVSQGFAIANVSVNASPTVSVNSGTICSGETFTITPTGANSYTIQGGNAIVSPTTTSSFTISGTNLQGCVSQSLAIANVTVISTPTIVISGTSTICAGQSLILTASGADTYSWNTGALTPSISVSPSVTTIFIANGKDTVTFCNSSASFSVSVDLCTEILKTNVNQSKHLIYPNPNNGSLIVVVDGECDIKLINSLGQIAYTGKLHLGENKVDPINIVKGIYTYIISKETSSVAGKMVVE